MKAAKIAAVLSVVMLLALCSVAPSVSAASQDSSGTMYIQSGKFCTKTNLDGGASLSSGSTCYVYTETEYDKMLHGEEAEYEIVHNGDTLCSESGTYGIVSSSDSIVTVRGASINTITLDRMEYIYTMFTGIKDTKASVHIQLNEHNGGAYVMVVKSTGYATVRTSGTSVWTNPDFEPYIICKQMYDEGTNTIDFSFNCSNTDNYYVLVGFETGQSVTYSMHVNGVAEYSDSNVISIILIIIALALLIGLLYISNKKIIK